MAKSARQTVFEGLELLPEALIPFVEKHLDGKVKGHWRAKVMERVDGLRSNSSGKIKWDLAGVLKAMMFFWKECFSMVLGRAERALISELLEVRNRHAHNEPFSYDDAERALDSMRRLLEAISAGKAASELARMRDTILRTKFTEQQRNEERRKPPQLDISYEPISGLLPWREVVEPHQDVAMGDFQQAEFAANLSTVHEGDGSDEYSNPHEFFSRTYLTDGLSRLLEGAAKRLSGEPADPVVELQTNFGGGKTHSMLALYHMAGKAKTQDLPGLDQLLAEKKLTVPEKVSRAVLVGTASGPLDPQSRKAKRSRKINTMWGEMAFQLGGERAFQMVAEQDAKGIAPGSGLLQAIFEKCAPNLILVDEWVVYLRQIYKMDGLPSGSFDANLSFVQSLTEAVKVSPKTLLVATLPASQIEVGGEGGKEALDRLKRTFSRIESSWRPASQEESYEIVRRRLFKQIPGDKYAHRDNTLKQFARMYRDNANDFPLGCADEDYRRKLEKAYPIHPDLFDHLYTAWGSLEAFQRTRGVLRLMAQVIHELWMSGDPSVMIMPGNIAIGSERVETELRRYLPDAWQSIIAGDVDGENSTPYTIDRAAANLNRSGATRRVARAVFMATAPSEGQQNPGISDKQINLGVVQPGEKTAIFGDALRRLTNQAKFMHSDRGRCWYSMSPSLNRMAADRAEQKDEAVVQEKIDKKLTSYVKGIKDRGHFDKVQVALGGSAEVPDEPDGVRAVVLGITHPHGGRNGSDALDEVKDILNRRGNSQRVYRNTLVFFAADGKQLDGLKSAMRTSLAWSDMLIDAQSGRLDLKTSDIVRVDEKSKEWENTVLTRLKETWCYLICPYQESPQSEIDFASSKVNAQDGVFDRASKKLNREGYLFYEFGPRNLNRTLKSYIWKERSHLHLKDLWEYLSSYIYLPRLKGKEVLVRTVQGAIGEIVPGPFAYAERWDEESQTYQGLAIDNSSSAFVTIDSDSLIVRSDVAEAHRPESAPDPDGDGVSEPDPSGKNGGGDTTASPGSAEESKPTRFQGTVMLPADRPSRDMGDIVEGIVEQLTELPDAEVTLKLEIDAEVPSGLDKAKVRTLIENANTLKFIDKSVK